MNRLQRLIPGLSLCLLLIAGCRTDDVDKGKIIQVSPEFYIDLFENLGNPRTLDLKISSLELQPCDNATIALDFQAFPSLFQVTLEAIQSPEDCNPGNAPAQTTLPLGALEDERDYRIQINLKNTIVNEGLLRVRPKTLQLDMESSHGLVLARSVWQRIPEGTIWGFVAYDDPTAEPQAQQFLTDLQNLTEHRVYPQGYYSHFSVESPNKLLLPETPPYAVVETFLRHFPGQKNQLVQLLENYRNGPGGNLLHIELFTANGERL